MGLLRFQRMRDLLVTKYGIHLLERLALRLGEARAVVSFCVHRVNRGLQESNDDDVADIRHDEKDVELCVFVSTCEREW